MSGDVLTLPIEGTLKADALNPRVISEEALAGLGVSVEEFGDLSGIVWNERTGELVSGHQRVRALRGAGATSWQRESGAGDRAWIIHPRSGERFPVRIVDWDPVRQRMANLVANNTAIAGQYTPAALDQLKELQAQEGFEALRLGELEKELRKEMAALLSANPTEPRDGNTDPDELPEAPPQPITRPGDLWLLGQHRLLCGDSSNAADVERLMAGARAVLMATDPPYGVDFAGAKYNPRAKEWAGIEGDTLTGSDLRAFLGAVLAGWLPHVDEAAGFYFWTAAMEEGAAAAQAIRAAGLHIQGQIMWVKNALVLGQADYQWKHENCWYAFHKGKQHRWFGGRDKTTVWEVKRVAASAYLHPMQKPVELYEIPMHHHTREGEVVAEPFSGSGTQIIAAERLGRRCFAMEVAPNFVDVAVARWEAFTGQKARRAE